MRVSSIHGLGSHGLWLVLVLLAITPNRLAGQDFSHSISFCTGFGMTTSIALGDIDGDGDLDLLFGSGRHVAQPDSVFLNDGRGNFYARRALHDEPDKTYGVAFGDVDKDGSLDVVVANDAGDPARIYLNDGKGNFRMSRWLGSGREARRSLALGDFDGDGDLDVVLVGPGQDHIYLNNGPSRWTERALGAGGDYSLTVAVGDVDGDRDIDVLVGNRKQQSIIYLNDGTGGFSETRGFGTGKDDTVSVALGDMDGDKDLDIVVGNWEERNAVYLNDGRGHFSPGPTFGDGKEQTWSVALGDIDLDGDLDVVAGRRGISTTFVDSNGDGRPDRWVDQNRNEPSRVYLNNGRGVLIAGSSVGTGNDKTRPVALGDLDGDGDLDVVVGNDCEPNAVFFNSLRNPSPPR